MTQRRLALTLAAMVAGSAAHGAGSSSTQERREERARADEDARAAKARAAAEAEAAAEAAARRKAYQQQRRRETEELSQDAPDVTQDFQWSLDRIQDADQEAMGGDQDGASEMYQEAAARLEKVVEVEPSNAEAWNQLGYSRRSAGDYPAALEAYQRALELRPGYAPAIEYRAEAHLALDRLQEVKEAYQTLFADPDHRQLAATLMHAVQWYVKVKEDAPPEGYAAFAAWAEERARLAQQADAGGDEDW